MPTDHRSRRALGPSHRRTAFERCTAMGQRQAQLNQGIVILTLSSCPRAGRYHSFVSVPDDIKAPESLRSASLSTEAGDRVAQ